jgi:dihydrofolate reductase
MSKVFVSVGMSLDGFIAGGHRGPNNPLGDGGPSIHSWIYAQRMFREGLGLGEGGETGPDNALLEATALRIGANIMGKRMFEEGERNWPENAPFHVPVFVLTQERREAWPRPGGTTFHFVNESVEQVLARAQEAAGDKDVRIAGGGNVILQYLNAGLVDELHIALTPVLLGQGLRLFDGIDPNKVSLQIEKAVHSAAVTHLNYVVSKR